MKRFLLLLLLLATPARADDSITALTWNSAKGTFQALTRALGWKDVPDYEEGQFSITMTGPYTTAQTVTAYFTRTAKSVSISLLGPYTQACSSTSVITGTAIPVSLRPVHTVSGMQFVYNNGAPISAPGQWAIGTTGVLSIYESFTGSGTFTGTGTCGPAYMLMNYPAN